MYRAKKGSLYVSSSNHYMFLTLIPPCIGCMYIVYDSMTNVFVILDKSSTVCNLPL